tara:strand:+ start:1412 stop:2113 length:702 start_codon:yes stop_codon:yes gene_type:complete
MHTGPFHINEGSVRYQLGEIKDGCIHYDFNQTMVYLDFKGKMRYGKHFKIYTGDHEILYKLMVYTIKDLALCARLGIDPQKGILLSGPVGCGKTTLMDLIGCIAPKAPTYKMVPSRSTVFQYNRSGTQVIEGYGQMGNACFDDLGVEPLGKHFGSECNVMGEILLSRYEVFQWSSARDTAGRNKKTGRLPITHATTNLNASELETFYGNRVRSRMRSMFNLLAFDTNAADKRL